MRLVRPVSGAHFNPVVPAADWLLGRGTGLSGRHVLAYSVAQTAGAINGAVLADAMFDVALVEQGLFGRPSAAH